MPTKYHKPLIILILVGLTLLSFLFLKNPHGIRKVSTGDYLYAYSGEKDGIEKVLFTNKASKLPSVAIKDKDVSLEFSFNPSANLSNESHLSNSSDSTKSPASTYSTQVSGNTLTYKDVL